jgi:hypothetical protein
MNEWIATRVNQPKAGHPATVPLHPRFPQEQRPNQMQATLPPYPYARGIPLAQKGPTCFKRCKLAMASLRQLPCVAGWCESGVRLCILLAHVSTPSSMVQLWPYCTVSASEAHIVLVDHAIRLKWQPAGASAAPGKTVKAGPGPWSNHCTACAAWHQLSREWAMGSRHADGAACCPNHSICCTGHRLVGYGTSILTRAQQPDPVES